MKLTKEDFGDLINSIKYLNVVSLRFLAMMLQRDLRNDFSKNNSLRILLLEEAVKTLKTKGEIKDKGKCDELIKRIEISKEAIDNDCFDGRIFRDIGYYNYQFALSELNDIELVAIRICLTFCLSLEYIFYDLLTHKKKEKLN